MNVHVVKAGIKTTEFWVTVAVLAFAGATVALGYCCGETRATGAVAVAAAAITAVGYAHGRSRVKAAH